MSHRLLAHPVAQRELDALPPRIADGIRRVLHAFAEDPDDPRFDVRRLRAIDARPPPYRLRIGAYRVVYQIDHEARGIRIARIGHRNTVYRRVQDRFARRRP